MRDSIDEHIAAWSEELTDLDPVQEAIIGRIHLLARHSTQGRQHALRSSDLIMWQLKTLLMLRKVGRPYTASPSQLAAMLSLTRGAMSIRLSTLEELGLVKRAHDATDRRRVQVTLTAAGHEALDATLGAEGEAEGRMLAGLTDAEKRALADLLRKVVLRVEADTG
ncbi:MAG TPA: MarR family transcriptional regulator [Nocardioidaceae bacterium]|nr:MarR family transcriptional regulator [Nocardioidaceae bacterium]